VLSITSQAREVISIMLAAKPNLPCDCGVAIGKRKCFLGPKSFERREFYVANTFDEILVFGACGPTFVSRRSVFVPVGRNLL